MNEYKASDEMRYVRRFWGWDTTDFIRVVTQFLPGCHLLNLSWDITGFSRVVSHRAIADGTRLKLKYHARLKSLV